MKLKLDKKRARFGTTINQNLKNRTVSQMKMAKYKVPESKTAIC